MLAYHSLFAEHIVGLIEQKWALGYKYKGEPALLRRFDRFCLEYYADESILSRKIVLHWAAQRPGEHPATLQGRVTPIRELAKYMANLGHPAFILPKGMLPRVPQYMPHIYSDDELKKIFHQTDLCHYCSAVPYRHHVMPLFFRLLYCCGLRLSESRLLKVGDVELSEGVITVTSAKLDRHRQIPISDELLIRMRQYHQDVHAFSKADDIFFPGLGGKAMTMGNVYKNFRKFLWQAYISHGGYGKGPRVHDFRHTFAVHCLRRWVLAGKDLRAYLPILQAYMGHVLPEDTAYYLHLTADLFPNITAQVETTQGCIIPRIENHDETH
jgi:integrase